MESVEKCSIEDKILLKRNIDDKEKKQIINVIGSLRKDGRKQAERKDVDRQR